MMARSQRPGDHEWRTGGLVGAERRRRRFEAWRVWRPHCLLRAPARRRWRKTRPLAPRCKSFTLPGTALEITSAQHVRGRARPRRHAGPARLRGHAARALPRRRRSRAAHGRQRRRVRHSLRARVARRLDRPVPVPGRRRLERQRRAAARRPGRRRRRPRSRAASPSSRNDTGHQGAVFDGSFFADQEAALNFLWLANGKVTVVAKAHHRRVLPQARRAFVLRRLLHGRPRSDDHVAALPDVLRRARVGRARDAHGVLEPRHALRRPSRSAPRRSATRAAPSFPAARSRKPTRSSSSTRC